MSLLTFDFLASLCISMFFLILNSCIFLLNCILLKLLHNFLLMVCSCVITNCTNIVYCVSYSKFLCYNPSHHYFWLQDYIIVFELDLIRSIPYFHHNVMLYVKFEFDTSHYSILFYINFPIYVFCFSKSHLFLFFV
jgi:hypothetical protein